MEQKIKYLFWLYKSKVNSKGIAPVFFRVTIAGVKTEISTGIQIPAKVWNSSKGIVKGTSVEVMEMNKRLDMMKGKAQRLYNEMINLDVPVSVELFKQKFNGAKEQTKTVLEAIIYHNNLIKERIGIEVSKATYTKYETMRKKVAAFVTLKLSRKDVFLKELNHQFVVQFETFLKVQQKIQHNPTAKYIQMLKKIIHLSIANGWIVTNPFNNFKCTMLVKDRGYLTGDELQAIMSKPISIERLSTVRDMFILCCYTGLSYSDLKKLSHSHLTTKEDGNRWIVMNRTKTGTRSAIPLLKPALRVLQKYEPPFVPDNDMPLLPVPSNQKMNAYLKEIGDICGINKLLTVHLGRHTFATTITLTNGVPIETVSKMLGHKSLKTTQHYSKVVDIKVQSDMTALADKINHVI